MFVYCVDVWSPNLSFVKTKEEKGVSSNIFKNLRIKLFSYPVTSTGPTLWMICVLDLMNDCRLGKSEH